MMLNYSEPHRPHVNMIRRTGMANYTQVDGFPEEIQTKADVEPLNFIGVDSELISLVDIAPTVMDLLGIKGGESAGISLLPGNSSASERKYLFSEFTNHGGVQHFPRRSVRDERYKLIVNFKKDNPVKFITGCAIAEELSKEQYTDSFIKSVYDRYMKPPQIELYDLKNDPWEFHNIADSNPREVRRLMRVLEQWAKETDDDVSYDGIEI